MDFEYQAYMLRLWPYEEAGQKGWRASLQTPGSDERHIFSSLEKLITFIQTQTGHTQNLYNFLEREDGQTNINISIRIQQTRSGDEDEN